MYDSYDSAVSIKSIYTGFYDSKTTEKFFSPCNTITGTEEQYMSDIFTYQDILNLNTGNCILINAPIGSGKTTCMLDIMNKLHNKYKFVYVVNRKALELQLRIKILKQKGVDISSWNNEAIMMADLSPVRIFTYQGIIHNHNLLYEHNTVYIFDEIHYILSDSTFSNLPCYFMNFIKQIQKNSIRIYMSATVDEAFPEIIKIDNNFKRLYTLPDNFSHINFRYYQYADINNLANELNSLPDKTLICIRNKARGSQLAELLNDNCFIYSCDDSEIKKNIHNLVETESFSSHTLTTTKIIDNGISITDKDIQNIVIEEADPVSWMQFLGRIRTNRSNPRPLTVYIPDYTVNELAVLKHNYSEQLFLLEKFCNRPAEYYHYITSPEFKEHIIYSDSRAEFRINYLAIHKYKNLISHINAMIKRSETNKHEYIRFCHQLIGKEVSCNAEDFIGYNEKIGFNNKISDIYQNFKDSNKQKTDKDTMIQEIIEVVKNSSVCKQKITGKNIQLDTINKILAEAEINEKIESLGECFTTLSVD